MKKIVFAFLMVSLSSCHNEDSTPINTIILSSMKTQEDAWNNGDLETFMETYWKSDSLLFVGSKGPVYGWQATLDRYIKSYPDTVAMGKLHFDILETTPLENEHYFVLGKFHLSRSIGDVSGHFTLIFKKIDGKWLIISDHSS